MAVAELIHFQSLDNHLKMQHPNNVDPLDNLYRRANLQIVVFHSRLWMSCKFQQRQLSRRDKSLYQALGLIDDVVYFEVLGDRVIVYLNVIQVNRLLLNVFTAFVEMWSFGTTGVRIRRVAKALIIITYEFSLKSTVLLECTHGLLLLTNQLLAVRAFRVIFLIEVKFG
jgi:hypothetical protein